jgi:hypothetical protein
MIVMILTLCLAVGVILFRLYRDLANLRRQLSTARAQIDAQLAVRDDLRASLKSELHSRAKPGAPAVVGVKSHKLLAELRAAEQKIEFATNYYNEIAAAYGQQLRVFPYSLVATGLRFRPQERLEFNMDAEPYGFEC